MQVPLHQEEAGPRLDDEFHLREVVVDNLGAAAGEDLKGKGMKLLLGTGRSLPLVQPVRKHGMAEPQVLLQEARRASCLRLGQLNSGNMRRYSAGPNGKEIDGIPSCDLCHPQSDCFCEVKIDEIASQEIPLTALKAP